MEICLLKLEYVVYISSVSCVVNLGVMLDSANSYLELGTESTIDDDDFDYDYHFCIWTYMFSM